MPQREAQWRRAWDGHSGLWVKAVCQLGREAKHSPERLWQGSDLRCVLFKNERIVASSFSELQKQNLYK